MNEALLTKMDDLCDDLFYRLYPELQYPFALFGHSMGGLLAFLFARRAMERGRAPRHIFISGKAGPAKNIDDQSYLLPSVEFREKLRKLGGMPAEMLGNEPLMEYLEPIIRADFRAVQTYRHQRSSPIDIPTTILLGEGDDVTADDARLWQDDITGAVDVLTFDGNHFFIYEHLESIGNIINRSLAG